MLQTTIYIINLVTSKSILKTPLELWSGRKPSLRHTYLGLFSTCAEKKDREARITYGSMHVCRISKRIKGRVVLQSLREEGICINKCYFFFKTNYMTNYKPHNKVVLEELLSDHIRPQSTIVIKRQSKETTSLNQENLPP